ncbi:putative glucosamine 6-phosphate acetyltransferase [Entophlyctis helioformis]|nr:putative glucosamine 6-phosphate acetyltransferase [Entophlyctis helioformis]
MSSSSGSPTRSDVGSDSVARTANPQFDAALLDQDMMGNLPAGYIIRPLDLDDYDHGEPGRAQFTDQFEWLRSRNNEYCCLVVCEVATGNIVGAGNILIERKFIHECGKVGHIEDIVVSSSMRGKSLGKWIIRQLVHVGKQLGAYKVLLACLDKNVGFYEKCGLKPKEVSMAIYLN